MLNNKIIKSYDISFNFEDCIPTITAKNAADDENKNKLNSLNAKIVDADCSAAHSH